MEFVTFIVSCVSSIWGCFKSLFSTQGAANEGGATAGSVFSGALSNLAPALGLAMLINPTGTGHLVGKIGSSAAGAITTTVGSVVDGVSDIANNLLKQPWFWVAGGVLVIWLLKD